MDTTSVSQPDVDSTTHSNHLHSTSVQVHSWTLSTEPPISMLESSTPSPHNASDTGPDFDNTSADYRWQIGVVFSIVGLVCVCVIIVYLIIKRRKPLAYMANSQYDIRTHPSGHVLSARSQSDINLEFIHGKSDMKGVFYNTIDKKLLAREPVSFNSPLYNYTTNSSQAQLQPQPPISTISNELMSPSQPSGGVIYDEERSGRASAQNRQNEGGRTGSRTSRNTRKDSLIQANSALPIRAAHFRASPFQHSIDTGPLTQQNCLAPID